MTQLSPTLEHSTVSAPETLPETPTELRARPLPGLGGAWIGQEEEDLVVDVIRRGEPFRYYGKGATAPPVAATLENEFRALIGTDYALAVTSGTAALEVALGALGVGPGDEVILPAWSWISCFTAVVRMGALPVLAEIDESLCLAPGEITRLATPRTKVALVVHYQGAAADMDPLLAEARAAGIKVLEDCAESAGVQYKGHRVGSLGDMGIFSFQFQKSMTSGEGGMVVTNDPLLYERAVRMHDIGQLRPYHRRLVEAQETAFAGSQFRMSELTAAFALAQLRKLERVRAHCHRLQARLLNQLENLSGLELRRVPDPAGDSGIETYLFLPTPDLAQKVKTELNALNVNCHPGTGTGGHYSQAYCINAQSHAPSHSPFKEFASWPAPGYREEDFPRTVALTQRTVALPLGVLYTDEDVDYMAVCVRKVLGNLA